MDILIIAVTILIILIGYLFLVIRILPGVPIVFAGILFYSFFTGFTKIPESALVLMAILTLLSFLIDWLSGFLGAKMYKATNWGVIGAVIGGVIGGLILNIPGVIFGPIVGAVIAEAISGRKFQEALRAGAGVFIGIMLGTVANVIIASTIVLLFINSII